MSPRRRHGSETDRLRAEVERLDKLLNTPEIVDFGRAVVLEAAHQRERWAASDPAKTDADWFWLIGYLAGKALHTPIGKDLEGLLSTVDTETFLRDKRLHRIITIAAAAANWHAAVLSSSVRGKESEAGAEPAAATSEAVRRPEADPTEARDALYRSVGIDPDERYRSTRNPPTNRKRGAGRG